MLDNCFLILIPRITKSSGNHVTVGLIRTSESSKVNGERAKENAYPSTPRDFRSFTRFVSQRTSIGMSPSVTVRERRARGSAACRSPSNFFKKSFLDMVKGSYDVQFIGIQHCIKRSSAWVDWTNRAEYGFMSKLYATLYTIGVCSRSQHQHAPLEYLERGCASVRCFSQPDTVLLDYQLSQPTPHLKASCHKVQVVVGYAHSSSRIPRLHFPVPHVFEELVDDQLSLRTGVHWIG
ncbi:hypothetical protein D3C71_1245960 [compost metagenome]